MSSRSEQQILKLFKQAYRKKWGAPIGKRKCKYAASDDCLGIDDEKQFKGRRCIECHRFMHRDLYAKRMVKQGKELVGGGRPKGSKDLKPRINAKQKE